MVLKLSGSAILNKKNLQEFLIPTGLLLLLQNLLITTNELFF